MTPMKRRRKRDDRSATAILRERRATLTGEIVNVTLQLADLSERWYQWTCWLSIALALQRHIEAPRAAARSPR